MNRNEPRFAVARWVALTLLAAAPAAALQFSRAPSISRVSIAPAIPSLPAAAVTATAQGAGASDVGAPAHSLESGLSPLSQARGLGDAASAEAAGSAGATERVSVQTFDGGRGGSGSGGSVGADDGHPLDKVYPKVVMILDAFSGPAPAAIVQYVEKLADMGVHVVFITARPEKGPDSAESVLIAQLRPRQGNPVMAVSYNGARITARKSTRSENPAPVVDDQEGFAQKTIETFRATSADVKRQFGLRGELTELAAPDLENAFIYGVELAKTKVPAAEIARAYNAGLERAGLNYRMEAASQADGKLLLFTQSTALRLNTGRIFAALTAQYPDLRDRLRQEDVLILADSTKAARFLRGLPGADAVAGRGYWIHGVTNEAELERGLFAVLHGRGLEDVRVTRNQLRAYADRLAWQERGRGFGGRYRLPPAHERYDRQAKFYRGIIIYHLMGELYHRIRNHNFSEATLDAALETLDDMWRNPHAYGIRLDPDMDGMRRHRRWKLYGDQSRGVIRQWLKGYYDRNFKDYPNGLSEEVVGTMLNLARDSGNGITLDYESPMTKRRYKVGVLPARGQVEKDEHGDYVLVAHAYRTGRTIRQDEFDESLEVNLLQRAMLKGYADPQPDGTWRVNGRPVRVMVVFHTMDRDIPSDPQTPAEIEARSAEVTALIEKMLSDKEFLAEWESEQARNRKVSAGADKARAKKRGR